MMKKKWAIRLYGEGDEDHICELHRLVFGKELGAERWHWQFRDNHTGVITITLAEGENRELVGQCALRPVRMKIGEKICLGAQSLDAMVHPDYRRQGIFTKIAAYGYRVAKDQGIPLIYGFPNRNSHYVLTHRLKRVDLWDSPPVFVKILDAKNVMSKRIRNRFLLSIAAPLGKAALELFYAFRRGTLPTDCRLEKVSRFDDCMDDLWEKALTPFSILVVRNKEYLNWRYVENPTEEYVLFVAKRYNEVVGYIILKCEEKFGLKIGFIVDMLTAPDESDVSRGLISEAIEYFRKQHMDIASCLMLKHVPYARSLKDNGFVIAPEKLFPQELHLSVRRMSDEYSDQFITDSRNWFVTWGDHDVV